MLRSEFETMTGIYPPLELYEVIEKHYNASDVAKDTFCEAYKKNTNGLAERIRSEADDKAYRKWTKYEDIITQKNAEIELLEKQLARMQDELEQESKRKDKQMLQEEANQKQYTQFIVEIVPLRHNKDFQKRRFISYMKKIGQSIQRKEC